MEGSLLDKITQGCNTESLFDGWANGKIGAIADLRGKYIFCFHEAYYDENKKLKWIDEKGDDAPVLAVGIVAYWLQHRKNNDPLSRLYLTKTKESFDIRTQFDRYTQIRYDQFRAQHKDNPDAWNWNWDCEFFCRFIIPREMRLNKCSEALFEYITKSDVQTVRSVMKNYIEYLKSRRAELGYEVCNELKVLRSVESDNIFLCEDLEGFEINAILDKLEGDGYVKVAWCEGHNSYDDVRMLNKGRVYLKQLESKLNAGLRKKDKDDGAQVKELENKVADDEVKAEVERLRERVKELEAELAAAGNAVKTDEITFHNKVRLAILLSLLKKDGANLEKHGNKNKAAEVMRVITGLPSPTCKNFCSDSSLSEKEHKEEIVWLNTRLQALGMESRL